MTTILPSARTPFDVIGQETGQALQQVLPGVIQQRANRENLQNSLAQIKNISANPSASNLDILLSYLQAGAGIPGSERYIGAVLPELMKFAEAKRMQNVPQAGEQGIPRNRQDIPQQQAKEQLPGFMGQQQQKPEFFPTNIGPQGGSGQVPQAATTGQKVPLLTPQEKLKAARELANERTKGGIPTKPQEALAEINASEEDKKLHNKAVDEELAQRVEGQQTYGQRSVDYLKNAFPKEAPPTPEMQAIFQKIGEEASRRGESEADTNRLLANEAKKFRNAFVNAEKDVSAPRSFNTITRALSGTYKNLEQAGNDVRKHLQPLLDLGLYDTARKLLIQKNYGIEETDAIIHPLGTQEQAIIKQVPNLKPIRKTGKGITGLEFDFNTGPLDSQNIKNALVQLQKADNNFSLPLARKAFEDLGYNWRVFKDALNELESEGFKLSDDQAMNRGLLDSPPLNLLEKFLESVNIVGR